MASNYIDAEKGFDIRGSPYSVSVCHDGRIVVTGHHQACVYVYTERRVLKEFLKQPKGTRMWTPIAAATTKNTIAILNKAATHMGGGVYIYTYEAEFICKLWSCNEPRGITLTKDGFILLCGSGGEERLSVYNSSNLCCSDRAEDIKEKQIDHKEELVSDMSARFVYKRKAQDIGVINSGFICSLAVTDKVLVSHASGVTCLTEDSLEISWKHFVKKPRSSQFTSGVLCQPSGICANESVVYVADSEQIAVNVLSSIDGQYLRSIFIPAVISTIRGIAILNKSLCLVTVLQGRSRLRILRDKSAGR